MIIIFLKEPPWNKLSVSGPESIIAKRHLLKGGRSLALLDRPRWRLSYWDACKPRKGETLPFLCPSPCDAGMEDEGSVLARGKGVVMEATEEFISVGDADVLAWRPANSEHL